MKNYKLTIFDFVANNYHDSKSYGEQLPGPLHSGDFDPAIDPPRYLGNREVYQTSRTLAELHLFLYLSLLYDFL